MTWMHYPDMRVRHFLNGAVVSSRGMAYGSAGGKSRGSPRLF
jgi:hypothetical protein